MCFLFLRVIRSGLPEAVALTGLFAVTGTQLFTAIIVEAYGPAGFGIAALWLVTASRLADGKSRLWQRYAIAVFSFGVTLTNVMQVFVAELLVSLRSVGPIEAVRRAIVFGLVLTCILAVLGVIVWHDVLLAALADPVLALKEIYWLRTKGFRVGAFQVVRTFLAYSFVSPELRLLAFAGGDRHARFPRLALFPGWNGGGLVLAGLPGERRGWRSGTSPHTMARDGHGDGAGAEPAVPPRVSVPREFVHLRVAHALSGVRAGVWAGAVGAGEAG